MTAKLKINLNEGLLEAEGTEVFVFKVYNDFKEKINVQTATKSNSPERFEYRPPESDETDKLVNKSKAPSKSKPSVKPASTGNLLTELNLRPQGKKTLKQFIAEFKKPSSEEKILLYVYFLINELKINDIGVDHIYTCIKEVGDKVPAYLKQTITNVKSRKGWLDTTNFEQLKYTVQGMNHVEHDLEKNIA
jgi:hypothetical protein